jgi:hypothetical protein
MELPDDVLGLVRVFSRPRMRFYKEYRNALTELGFKRHEHWRLLRDKLCTSDAEVVFHVFILYKEAMLGLRRFHELPWKGPYSLYHDDLEKLIKIRDQLERAFRALLVGETRVANHERWVRHGLEDGEYD